MIKWMPVSAIKHDYAVVVLCLSIQITVIYLFDLKHAYYCNFFNAWLIKRDKFCEILGFIGIIYLFLIKAK